MRRAPAARWRRPGRDELFFGVALLLLLVVAGWWLVFLADFVNAEHADRLEIVRLEARILARDLRRDVRSLGPGAVPGHAGFEITRAGGDDFEAPVDGTPWAVRPTAELLAGHDERHARRRLMTFGEGALFLTLIGVSALALRRLHRAEASRRDEGQAFLGRVTGEVQEPVRELRRLLDDLRAAPPPEEELRAVAERGLREAERAEHLVEALLMTHRLAAGAVRPREEDVELGPWLRDFLAHRGRTMVAVPSRYRLDCPDGLTVRADPTTLHVILESLVDAADRGGASGIDLHVVDGPLVTLETRFREARATVGARRGAEGLGLSVSRALLAGTRGGLEPTEEGYRLVLPRA